MLFKIAEERKPALSDQTKLAILLKCLKSLNMQQVVTHTAEEREYLPKNGADGEENIWRPLSAYITHTGEAAEVEPSSFLHFQAVAMEPFCSGMMRGKQHIWNRRAPCSTRVKFPYQAGRK